MKKIKSIFFLVILLSAQLYGQSEFSNWEMAGAESNRLGEKLTGTMYYINTISNSNFFLHKKWLDGTILLETGDFFEDQRLRYMSRNDELVVYNKTLKNLFIIDKAKVKRFSIFAADDTLHFKKLHYDGFASGDRYFEELYSGEASFLAFHVIEEKKTLPFRDVTGILRDTWYIHSTHYYLYSESKGFLRMHNSRRSFFSVFPDKKKQIRRLFRKNKLRIFDKEEMIRAVHLLDKAGFFN